MRNAEAGTEQPCDSGRCPHAPDGSTIAHRVVQLPIAVRLNRLPVARFAALPTSDALNPD